MFKLKYLVLPFILFFSISIYAQEVIDTQFLQFDKKVDNAFVQQYTSTNTKYFSNIFSVDAALYKPGGFMYVVGVDRDYNMAYYYTDKNDYKFYAIDLNNYQRSLELADKVATTRCGKIYIIDANREKIYYWSVTGDTFNPTGKIEYNFKNLEDVFADLNDDLYILDNEDEKIYKYSSPTNTFVNIPSSTQPYFSYAQYASSEMGKARGIVFANNNIFLVFECGTILNFYCNGTFVKKFTIGEANLGLCCRTDKAYSECWLEDITYTPYGYILVLDKNSKKVHIFDYDLNYIASWYDPAHPIDDNVNEIKFINGYANFFVAYSWGLCSYYLFPTIIGAQINSNFIYPDYVCEAYKGIEVKLGVVRGGTVDITLSNTANEYKIIDHKTYYSEISKFYWDGKSGDGRKVEYGDYKLKFFFNTKLVSELNVSVKQPPTVNVIENDGQILSNEKPNTTYHYIVNDPGSLKISISELMDGFQPKNEKFIYDKIVDKGNYSQKVALAMLNNQQTDNYYKIRFQIVPQELLAYNINVNYKDRIFAVDNTPFNISQPQNNRTGFNPYYDTMNTIQTSFTLSEGAWLTVDVVNESGLLVKELYKHEYFCAGDKNISWNGYKDLSVAADGKYKFVIKAEEDYLNITKEVTSELFALDTTPATIILSKEKEAYYFSPDEPSSVSINDDCVIECSFNENVTIDCNVLDNNGLTVKTITSVLKLGANSKYKLLWDGKDNKGALLPDAQYNFKVNTEDDFGNKFLHRFNVYIDNNRLSEQSKESLFISDFVKVNKNTVSSIPDKYYTSAVYNNNGLIFTYLTVRPCCDYNILSAQLFDSCLNKVKSEFIVPSNLPKYAYQNYPNITVLNNGYLLSWSSVGDYVGDGRFNTKGIYAQLYDNNGNILKSDFLVSTFNLSSESKAAQIKDGFVIIWESRDNSPAPYYCKLYAQIYDITGNKKGNSFEIENDITKDNVTHNVFSLKDNFITVWCAYDNTNSRGDIKGRIFDYTGKALTSRIDVNVVNNNLSFSDPYCLDLGNKFIVAWRSRNKDQTPNAIHGQLFNYQGQKIGTEFILSDCPLAKDFFKMSLYKDGFLVSWITKNSTLNTEEVVIKRFTLAAQPSGATLKLPQININGVDKISTPELNVISDQLLLTSLNYGEIYAGLLRITPPATESNLTAQIMLPAQDRYLTKDNFSIKGIVSDRYIDKYRLSLRDGTNIQILKEANQNINGDIYYMDIHSLISGIDYTVKLEAWDKAGNYRVASFILNKALDANGILEGFQVDKEYSSLTNPPHIHFDLKENATLNMQLMDMKNTILKTYNLGTRTSEPQDYVLDIANVSDGMYFLKLIIDNPNYGTSECRLKFNIDNTVPTVTIEGLASYYSKETNISPVVTITESNLKAFYVSILDSAGSLVKEVLTSSNLLDLVNIKFSAPDLNEGSYKLYVETDDKAGNISVSEKKFIIDRSSPVLGFLFFFYTRTTQSIIVYFSTVITDLSGIKNLLLIWEATGNSEKILYNGTIATNYPFIHPWSLSSSDKKIIEGYVKISITDNAGNESLITKKLIIDNLPPEVNICFGQAPQIINAIKYTNPLNPISFAAESKDSYSTVAHIGYKIEEDGVWNWFNAPFYLSEEGLHTIRYYATDNHNIQSDTKQEQIIIDANPPVLNYEILDPKCITSEKVFVPLTMKLNINASDVENSFTSGINTIEYCAFNGDCQPYNEPAIKILKEGPTPFSIRVTDKAGNMTEKTITNLVVDLAPPLTNLIPDHESYYSSEKFLIIPVNTQLSLIANDTGAVDARSGVAKVFYVLNTIESEYNSPISISAGAPTSLAYYSIDKVGNKEPTHIITVCVDNAPPSASLNINGQNLTSSNVAYAQPGIPIELTATDNLSGVKAIFYNLNGTAFEKYTHPLVFNEESEIMLSYYAEDNIGLKSVVKELRLVIDNTAPITTIIANHPLIYVNGKYYADDNFVYKFVAQDAQSGIAETVMTLDGVPFFLPILYTNTLADGEHTLTYYSKDKAGNIEQIKTIRIVTPVPPELKKMAQDICINFQPPTCLIPDNYLPDYGECLGARNGYTYGWNKLHTDVVKKRNINPDLRLDTIAQIHSGGKWEIELANGEYQITISIGDPEFDSSHTIYVEGVNYWNDQSLAANQFLQKSQLISITDGYLTIDAGAAGEKLTRINAVDIRVKERANQAPQVTVNENLMIIKS